MEHPQKQENIEQLDTIVLYEAVADLTKQMLQVAKQQDWDALAKLEVSCANYVATLKTSESTSTLSSDVRARKLASIKRILADDRELRNIVSPWMVRINSLMSGLNSESNITRNYPR